MHEREVYDVTKFVEEHPGGQEAILQHCGEDATQTFIEAGHSDEAYKSLQMYKIGMIKREVINVEL